MKKTYYGDWSTNNASSYNREPYTFTNLKEARKTMRSIAWGNTFKGNIGHWQVYDSLESRQVDRPIASGIVKP